MRKESLFIISICLLAIGPNLFGCHKEIVVFKPPPPIMAVASFENKAGEHAEDIGSGVADMLIQELKQRNCPILERTRRTLDQIMEE